MEIQSTEETCSFTGEDRIWVPMHLQMGKATKAIMDFGKKEKIKTSRGTQTTRLPLLYTSKLA